MLTNKANPVGADINNFCQTKISFSVNSYYTNVKDTASRVPTKWIVKITFIINQKFHISLRTTNGRPYEWRFLIKHNPQTIQSGTKGFGYMTGFFPTKIDNCSL
jgi:hypothetical protein